MEETAADVEARVRQWIEEAVIGLEFCPFAASVYHRGLVRIAVSDADDAIEVVETSLDEADRLLGATREEISTTLVVFPDAVGAFRRFLDAAETVRGALSEAGADGVLQVATFHPDYQFAGTEPEDVENYTNRSPYPIIHLLRESEVTEAVDEHPDPEGIPDDNVERLRAMERAEIEAMWETWEPDGAS